MHGGKAAGARGATVRAFHSRYYLFRHRRLQAPAKLPFAFGVLYYHSNILLISRKHEISAKYLLVILLKPHILKLCNKTFSIFDF